MSYEFSYNLDRYLDRPSDSRCSQKSLMIWILVFLVLFFATIAGLTYL